MAHPAPVIPPVPARFSVAQYHRLLTDGVLSEDDHVELLEGVVVAMAPHGVGHAAGVRRADHALRIAVGDRAVVQCQLTLTLGDHCAPEPDVAVLRGTLRDYDDRYPTSALLVVEVADSSLKQDRITKGSIYAEHGVPEYWIVNLLAEEVEVHREPRTQERRYGVVAAYRRGEQIALQEVQAAVAVDDLLPPRS